MVAIFTLAKYTTPVKLFLLTALSLYSSLVVSTEVLVLAPKNSVYWTSVYEPMKPVAKQLGINLSILRPPREARFDFVPELQRYLDSHKKPDWIIWAPRSNSPVKMLELLEKNKIYSINVSNPIVENQEVGQPMDIYKYWKAEISSSNYIGTYKMMSKLVKIAHQYHTRPPYSLIAITGNQYLKSAQKVTSSIHTVTEEIRNLRLLQIVHTDWSRLSAQDKTEKLLKRHHFGTKIKDSTKSNNVDLIWAGNIDLALGVVDAVDKFTNNHTNVRRPLVVSQGWHPDIFNHVESNQIQLSVGGNHLNGVWALVLIYDHLNGIKLNQSSFDKVLVIDKFIAAKENVKALRKIFDVNFWKTADIKQYSKTQNKQIKHYEFGIDTLISEF